MSRNCPHCKKNIDKYIVELIEEYEHHRFVCIHGDNLG